MRSRTRRRQQCRGVPTGPQATARWPDICSPEPRRPEAGGSGFVRAEAGGARASRGPAGRAAGQLRYERDTTRCTLDTMLTQDTRPTSIAQSIRLLLSSDLVAYCGSLVAL